jgi:hypothetical protein
MQTILTEVFRGFPEFLKQIPECFLSWAMMASFQFCRIRHSSVILSIIDFLDIIDRPVFF